MREDRFEICHGYSIMLNCQRCRLWTDWELWEWEDGFRWICERCMVYGRTHRQGEPDD